MWFVAAQPRCLSGKFLSCVGEEDFAEPAHRERSLGAYWANAWIAENDASAIRRNDEHGNVLTEEEWQKLSATVAEPPKPTKKGFTDLGQGYVRDSATGNVYKLRSDGNSDVWENTPENVRVSDLVPSDPSKMNPRKIYDRVLAEQLTKKMQDRKRDVITI